MLRSVLLVVDSSCIARVIRRAAQLPLTADASLTIVEKRTGERTLLELWALGLLAPRRRIRWLSCGAWDPSSLDALARFARAELVMLGSAGRRCRGIARILGRLPVLVVRTESREMYRRPLVAIEAVEPGRYVLAFLREVLTARPPMSAVHVSEVGIERARLRVRRATESFGGEWTRYLATGDVASNIVRTASATHADLVVMGSRHGGVSRSVLREVACDVLAVPVAGGLEA